MSRRISNSIILVLALLLCGTVDAGAQAAGGYSPYSVFGIGNTSRQGTAYNKSMGGVGIANRNNRYINVTNPAAVTARDSLAFMADFSLYGDNTIFAEGSARSANNVFNINDIVISFPIQDQSAMMIGVMPYSDTGFGFSFNYTDPALIGNTGSVSYAAAGQGSIYKFFAGAGVTFFKRLSLGAQFDYYFGNISKDFKTAFADNSYVNIENGTSLIAKAVGGKFGLQYEQPIGTKIKLGIGATYSTKATMRGFYEDSKFASGTASKDTLRYRFDTLGVSSKVNIPTEIAVGISIRHTNIWMAEINYLRSDWTKSNLESISGYPSDACPFATTTSETLRIGFEYIPNINDIRYYFNRVAYRAGAYYKKEHYAFQGNPIISKGVTIGATLPIYRWYNGLTLGFEFGQRGTLQNNLIRERYFNFSIGINIFDIWFQKPQYE